jgi:alkylation response protein AidB-like acyl-CoA dehydrogenase
MDVRFSPEQHALRTSAAQLVDRLGPRTVADLDDVGRRAKLRAAVTESGFYELRGESDGGSPLASGVEVAIVAEELGRGLADVAFLGPTLAADVRRRAGAAPAEHVETVVLDAELTSVAVVGGAELPIAVAVDADSASAALLTVADPVTGAHGLGRVQLRPAAAQLDLTRPVAEVIDSAGVIALGGPVSDDDLTACGALGLTLTCADLVGVMRGALSMARDYAMTRRQYDAPIGSFQAVQHVLADALVAVEGSCSVALHAAWAVDALPPPDALAAASVAKAYCARAARNVCEAVVQVHGGIGNTWDCLAHVYLRRALLSSELFSGPATHVERVLTLHGID